MNSRIETTETIDNKNRVSIQNDVSISKEMIRTWIDVIEMAIRLNHKSDRALFRLVIPE